jgi:hypothetical protein
MLMGWDVIRKGPGWLGAGTRMIHWPVSVDKSIQLVREGGVKDWAMISRAQGGLLDTSIRLFRYMELVTGDYFISGLPCALSAAQSFYQFPHGSPHIVLVPITDQISVLLFLYSLRAETRCHSTVNGCLFLACHSEETHSNLLNLQSVEGLSSARHS